MKSLDFKPLTISILSGKGGVGKSNIALNLAYALHNRGNSILLVDGDLGLANLDIMLGITPNKSLEDIIKQEADPKELLINLEQGFDFLPASSGLPEVVDWSTDLKKIILEKLNDISKQYNYTIFDLGAGIHESVIMFASMTLLRCIIITNEPTSLTDAYAVIKILYIHKNIKNFFIVVNMVKDQQEGKMAFERLRMACEKFLGLKLNLLGIVEEDKEVSKAIRKQVPLYKIAPYSKANTLLKEIAEKVVYLHEKINPLISNSPLILD